MKNNYIYTKSQINAIKHDEGPAAVFAGPGSGKTLVLVERIFYLVYTLHVSPKNILVITFTRAAAKQMKERFFQKNEKHLPIVFKTFHAFFYQILSQSISHKNIKIITSKEKTDILNMIAIEVFSSREDNIDLLEQLSLFISKRKDEEGQKEKTSVFSKEEENKILQIYEEEKNKIKKNDFVDLVYLCFEELIKNSRFLEQIRMQFLYVLIDEFQDITPTQYEIIKIIIKKTKNIFIVGDEDQSIYRFCGSRSDCMKQFLFDFPNAKIYLLEDNFRSSKIIVQKAEKLIKNNKNRIEKNILSKCKQEGKFEIIGFLSREEEEQYIIEKIINWEEEAKGKKDNELIKSIAVIARTKSSMRRLQSRFRNNHILVESKQKEENSLQCQIVKDIYAYLNFAKNGYMREDLLKILNKPMRYIRSNIFRNEKVIFEEVLLYIKGNMYIEKRIKKLMFQMNLIKKMSVSGAIHFIRAVIGYDIYLEELASVKNESSKEWFKELDLLEESTRTCTCLNQFEEFIKSDYLNNLCDRKQMKIFYDSFLKVEILTMHAAKGLEFDCVFIMDVNEGNIPHPKALKKLEIEEERRLLYVAITRAKKEAYLLYIDGNENDRHIKSRYIKECMIENTCP